ncbi:MAG: neutral/alkaline non-lysosomal ceramidase N-terminal domain-containing protein [bacterium]
MNRRLSILFCTGIAWVLTGPGCEEESPKLPEPEPLMAGMARARIPAPVGIGTVGNAGFNVEAEPSPFAEIYPATTRIHGHPEFKVVVLSQGPNYEVVFIRSDTVGIFQHVRRAIALEVEARLGRPFGDQLIFGGTHTHSGPGRIIDGGGVLDIIADEFLPEYYLALVDTAATVIMDAYADLSPARVGHAWGANTDGHHDRRCDDGLDYTNDALPVIAVEREGQIDAVVFAYAVHGTAVGIDELTLTKDVSGGIEEFVEAGFDHPVMAMFYNSWGADMAPGTPDVPMQAAAMQPDGYEKMLRVGRSVADSVHDALTNIAWDEDPTVFAESHNVQLHRGVIGYAEDEFEYEWGGVYCNGTETLDCDPTTDNYPWHDDACLPFPEQIPAPRQTVLSAGQIGSLYFVTFPGEPGTLLAEELLQRLENDHGYENVMFFGYTQDYCGYSILEDDWWQGGYEAGGAMWGPRQGEYLVDMAEAVFELTHADGAKVTRHPDAAEPIEIFVVGPDRFDAYVPTPPDDLGTIVEDASPLYGVEDVVVVTVAGSDPWLLAPVATLIDSAGDPVLLPNGLPVTSDGYGFWVDLSVTPLYSEEMRPASREFLWTFNMPIRQPVAGLIPELSGGSYRLRISLPTDGDPLEVTSAEFAVQ